MDYQIWLTKLLGFDFEIIYKAGVENKAADGLSRIKYENQFNNEGQLCALTVSLNLQMQEVIEKVDSDHEIQQEIQDIVQGKAIKKGHLMIKKGYSINKGRLFYKGRLVLSRTSKYILHYILMAYLEVIWCLENNQEDSKIVPFV